MPHAVVTFIRPPTFSLGTLNTSCPRLGLGAARGQLRPIDLCCNAQAALHVGHIGEVAGAASEGRLVTAANGGTKLKSPGQTARDARLHSRTWTVSCHEYSLRLGQARPSARQSGDRRVGGDVQTQHPISTRRLSLFLL